MTLKDHIVTIHDVFSARKKFNKEQVFKPLANIDRNKILLLYRDIISGKWKSTFRHPDAEMFWSEVHNLLEHRLGRPILSQSMQAIGLFNYQMIATDLDRFLSECTSDEFLDFIELSFKVEHPSQFIPGSRVIPGSREVIEAINEVFHMGDLPYHLTHYETIEEEQVEFSYQNRRAYTQSVPKIVAYPRIIIVEEEVAYKEAVEPTLAILGHHQFAAANSEFRHGLEHYRRGRHQDCLTSCGSALESVLKVICDRKGWNYNNRAALGELLDLVIAQLGLEAVYAEKFKLLATIRNRSSSSHGGGGSPRVGDRHLAQYMVTDTAATIVFLVTEADGKR